jgi:hypothetical protein
MNPTNGRYDPGPSLGAKWGCAAAALVGIPLFSITILISALGDCVPDTPCNHKLIWWLIVPAIIIATGVGVRMLINWIMRRKRTDC